MKTYPLADDLSSADKKRLGFSQNEPGLRYMASLGVTTKKVHAVCTGTYRAPRADEWYLSGSVPEAYRARNDLATKYRICKLVRTTLKR